MFVAGLLVRIGLAEYVLTRVKERLPDSVLYEAYARCIYQGTEYRVGDSRSLRMPGYPAFIAACWRLSGGENLRAVLYGQAMLGTLTGWIVYRLGRRFEEKGAPLGTAWLAAAITLFEPYSLIVGALELSETLFTTFFVACAYFATRVAERGRVVDASFLGLFAAMAIYVRPSALLLAPIAAVLVVLLATNRPPSLRWLAACAAVMAVLLAPWWIRNARLYGRPVLTTLNVGESLYDGWNPRATGGSDMSFKNDPEVPPLGELERDEYWRKAALEFAREHPGKVLALALRKIVRLWSPWPNEARFRTPAVTMATTIATVAMYAFAILGLAAAHSGVGGSRWMAWLIIVPIVYYSLLHAIFVSSVRYRVPLLPLLALAAGMGLATLVRRWLPAVDRSLSPPC